MAYLWKWAALLLSSAAAVAAADSNFDRAQLAKKVRDRKHIANKSKET
jgi:hypothetical protein